MRPLVIEDRNLSGTWSAVLEHIVKHSGKEINPLLISITDFSEDQEIRYLLDEDMIAQKMPSIETVSETIFPLSLYRVCKRDKDALYAQYMRQYPRIQALDRGNKKGTYFQRLIAYKHAGGVVNQLDNVITSILDPDNNRRSKLQASIFDPGQDHTEGPYQKFPCLQHVTFYKSELGGLVLNGFYAVQFFYRRAYGNWLGLIELGKFVAENTGLEFERLNCYIGVEQLDHLSKGTATDLMGKIEAIQNR